MGLELEDAWIYGPGRMLIRADRIVGLIVMEAEAEVPVVPGKSDSLVYLYAMVVLHPHAEQVVGLVGCDADQVARATEGLAKTLAYWGVHKGPVFVWAKAREDGEGVSWEATPHLPRWWLQI